MVVAYVVGKSLTTFQVSVASTVYVVGCIFMVFSNYSHVRDAITARQQAVAMAVEISPGVGLMPTTWAGISGAIYFSFVIGSLVFIWQVRHPRPE
jgi:hypothetical protein